MVRLSEKSQLKNCRFDKKKSIFNLNFFYQTSQLKSLCGKRGRPRAIPVDAQNLTSRKSHYSWPKQSRNVRFRVNIFPRDRHRPPVSSRSRSVEVDRGHGINRPPKNTPNRSLLAHIMIYIGHTSVNERTINAWMTTNPSPYPSPTGFGGHRLLCHTDILNGVSKAKRQ